jgi:hypothetical protein
MGKWLKTRGNGSNTRNTHFCQVLEKYVAFQHIGFHMSQTKYFLFGSSVKAWLGSLGLGLFRGFCRIDVNLGFAGCLATSDLHCMGVICFVLASPPTTGSMCSIFGVLWALLSFLWSFIDPGT